jgi:trigger factor
MAANVLFEKKDNLNALLTINISQDDYKHRVEEQLKEYRKKANIPGFRRGLAPIGMVKRLVGKSILADEINQLVNERLLGYLKENNVDILGEPLPSKETPTQIDFDSEIDFIFHFDLGLSPSFELNVSPKDKLYRYNIKADKSALDEELDRIRKRYGSLVRQLKTESLNDSVSGLLTELDENGQTLEGGVASKPTTVLLEMVKDKETFDKLMGLEVGSRVDVDIFKLFNNNEGVISNTLGLPKEGVKDLNPLFLLEATEIKRFEPAKIDHVLFDKVFGEGVVNNEAEFLEKIEENLEMYFSSEAEHHLDHQIQHLLMDNHKFQLPDSFLKRWLKDRYADTYNDDNIDDRYEKEADTLKMQLISERIISQFHLEVTKTELDQTSIGYTAQMLRQYGMSNPDPELISTFERKNREDKHYMDRIRDMVIHRKVDEQVKQMITIEGQDISSGDFYKMIEEHNKKHNH